MKRNRKISKKMSVVATNTMRFGAIVVFFFVMVILNILSSSSCTQLLKERGVMERELAALNDRKAREEKLWAEMVTPENIERALLRHGLEMKPPKPEQNIAMMANGLPRPGQGGRRQLSIAKAAKAGGAVVASSGDRGVPSTRTPYRRARRR